MSAPVLGRRVLESVTKMSAGLGITHFLNILMIMDVLITLSI